MAIAFVQASQAQSVAQASQSSTFSHLALPQTHAQSLLQLSQVSVPPHVPSPQYGPVYAVQTPAHVPQHAGFEHVQSMRHGSVSQ
jgi:hypothetical protein